jgi:peptidase E
MVVMAGQIVAMGGGSFGLDGRFTPLDRYALGLVSRPRPRVCFLPTASAENPQYVMRFYEAYASSRCEPSHLLLFGRPRTDIRDFLLSQDVIYVGGGNTANMLAVWRVHGVDRVLAEAWRRGIVLTGVSAGMICWFEAGVTDSFGPLARLDDGLALLPGSACPHYDGEVDRRPTYRQLVASGFPAGHAADDGAALHFVDRTLHACIAGRSGARAWRVEERDGTVEERALPTELLPPA